MARACVNPNCERSFEPDHPGHFWCGQMCRQSHFKIETGKDLSPFFGFLTDRTMVREFDAKWSKDQQPAA
jgi:hypothetical protein